MNLAQLTAKAAGALPDFLRQLGYEVDWDFDRHGRWYEVYDNGRMVFQIDEWATLEEFLLDLPVFAAGDRRLDKGADFNVTYECRCPLDADIRECYRRVQERAARSSS